MREINFSITEGPIELYSTLSAKELSDFAEKVQRAQNARYPTGVEVLGDVDFYTVSYSDGSKEDVPKRQG